MLNKQNGRYAVVVLAIAIFFLAGVLLFQGRPSQQEALLAAAPAELVLPADPQQLGAWCTARKAQGTVGLSSRTKNWLTDCVTLFGGGSPSPSVTQSPSSSPTPSPTVQPSPTVSPSPTASPSPTSSPSPTPTGDVTPPSTPTGLVVAARSPTILSITWAASTDNVGVVGYQFDRGTTNLGVTPTPDWLDAGLQPNTTYTYRTRAVDAAGNVSAYATVTGTTPANPLPTPGNNCQANPGSCGFPDAASTGPTGTLTTLNRTTFSTSGERISGVRIPGCVNVTASNVTFTNVEFTGADCSGARIFNNSTSLFIIDSYISCGGSNGTGVSARNFSLLRVEITGCENGVNIAGNVSITDSWMHDLVTANGAHTDGAQINQGATDILFQHNTIISPAPGGTSAIIMWDEGDPQNARVTIASNLLAGGTYTLYCGRTGPVDNIRITNNRFGDFQYGYANACNSGEVWTGNVLDSTGAAIGAQ